jgi:hypothetical protein
MDIKEVSVGPLQKGKNKDGENEKKRMGIKDEET